MANTNPTRTRLNSNISPTTERRRREAVSRNPRAERGTRRARERRNRREKECIYDRGVRTTPSGGKEKRGVKKEDGEGENARRWSVRMRTTTNTCEEKHFKCVKIRWLREKKRTEKKKRNEGKEKEEPQRRKETRKGGTEEEMKGGRANPHRRRHTHTSRTQLHTLPRTNPAAHPRTSTNHSELNSHQPTHPPPLADDSKVRSAQRRCIHAALAAPNNYCIATVGVKIF